MIRAAEKRDAAAIAAIYNAYIKETIVTFELDLIDAHEIESRLDSVAKLGLPWIVYEAPTHSQVLGYAYATRFRDRIAYQHTVETAVYLSPEHCGQGMGRHLYATLISQLQPLDLHRAIGVISLPNPASIRLHESVGFRPIGVLTEAGRKFDQWIDVGLWELDLGPPNR